MRVKIFEGVNFLNDFQKQRGIKCLEEQVQDWLRENHEIAIRNIKQSSVVSGQDGDIGTSTVISIWYQWL